MRGFISKKLSFALLLCSWCAALAVIMLLNYALAGPRLSPVYDALMGFRSQPPISGQILFIETEEVIEPGDIFSVLMAVSEMGASDMLIEVPVLGNRSGIAETGLEFSYRINDEFSLLGRNIRNLFEAIRMGLVHPAESPAYVENLVELTERGRDRLNAAIIRQDEAGSAMAAQAEAVFGKSITAADLRPVPAVEIPWYSKSPPDRDGVIRRVAPVFEPNAESAAEHIVYHALRPRWDHSSIETDSAGQVLINSFRNKEDEIEHRFRLDQGGNILVEKPKPGKGDFRRLTLGHFRDYDQTGRTLARLLKDAQALGIYAGIPADRIPLFLFDHSESLKEELLKNPSASKKTAWIDARSDYIAGLDEFLLGPSETTLVNGYEELIALEGIGEDGIAKLQDLRNELIRTFAGLREKYKELVELRALLAAEISSSFCIMGPSAPGGADTATASALLANALLTGHSVTPGQEWFLIAVPVAASFLVLACIHTLGPLLLLMLGLALSFLCGAGFGASFVINGYWIDPFIPAGACLGGTLVLTLSRFFIGLGRRLRFRFAYSGLVSGSMLRQMLKIGRPMLYEVLCSQSMIIAAKNPGISNREDKEKPLDAAKSTAQFRKEFSRFFKQKGALVLGFENDIALACFGSPPERLCGQEITTPAARAINSIREILRNPLFAEWRFGIESGECAFAWSETEYTASGRPAIRARIFSTLAVRYNVRAVIGEAAREDSNVRVKKLAVLAGENFYELQV